MSTKKRAAFTLVELLVVIAVIGILVSLVSAAAMQAINSAQRVVCTNNQHEIWTATQVYESKKQRFPGWRATVGGRQASWTVQLMPFLGMQNEYDRVWTNSASTITNLEYTVPADSPTTGMPAISATAHPSISIMACPIDDQDTPGGPWISYGVNSGVLDGGAGAAAESQAKGVFFDHVINTTTNPVPIYTNASYIQGRDGVANTLGLAENRRLYTWTGFGPTGTTPLEYLTGFLWENYTTAPTSSWLKYPINQTDTSAGKLLTATATDSTGARISGPHGNIAVVTFVDGHIIAMNSTIDYTVYNKLCTADGSSLNQTPLDAAEFNK